MKTVLIVLLFISASAEAMLTKAKPGISVKTPVCGVLSPIDHVQKYDLSTTLLGTTMDKNQVKIPKVLFLVPDDLKKNSIKRYHILHQQISPVPLESYGAWWGCVTKGWIIKPAPSQNPNQYGIIGIQDINLDQSNAERGME